MRKDDKSIWYILIMCFAALVYYNCFVAEPEPKVVVEMRVPTIPELQEFLEVEPDGVIGPQTIKAYEQYTFNQYAAPYFTATGKPE